MYLTLHCSDQLSPNPRLVLMSLFADWSRTLLFGSAKQDIAENTICFTPWTFCAVFVDNPRFFSIYSQILFKIGWGAVPCVGSSLNTYAEVAPFYWDQQKPKKKLNIFSKMDFCWAGAYKPFLGSTQNNNNNNNISFFSPASQYTLPALSTGKPSQWANWQTSDA